MLLCKWGMEKTVYDTSITLARVYHECPHRLHEDGGLPLRTREKERLERERDWEVLEEGAR